MDDKNLHQGHRSRMIEKAKSNIDILSEHEILEVLLYPLVPRKDTNLLAHKIIKAFGSLKNVFSAPYESLILGDGIGDRIASQLVVIGKTFKLVAKSLNKNEDKRIWSSLFQTRKMLKETFDGLDKELFMIVFLDKKFKEIYRLAYETDEKFLVAAELPEMMFAINHYQPAGIILAHNHPSGRFDPSEKDDIATKKINLLCNLYGLTLFDPIIYTPTELFSYYKEGRLSYIKEVSDFNTMFTKKEIENE